MANKKEATTVHSVAAKIAQALLKIKPDKGRRRRKRQGKPPR
jgi:hypothetical protein